MANRQFKTHCKIIDYVDSVNPELGQIIRGVCVEMSLGSLKGKPGITFLMPQDKAFLKKLSDLAYSGDVEDVDKANDMLNNLIIRDVFKTPGEWMAHKDDIPNSLFPSQHIEVVSASGSEVKFASGATAVIDTGFKDSSKKRNLAVWKLTGEIPVTTDKIASRKYAMRGKGKTGGYLASDALLQRDRYTILKEVERAYWVACTTKHGSSWFSSTEVTPRSVYLNYTMSLVDYLLEHHREIAVEKVIPMLSFTAVDFYYLVEPHRDAGDYLIDHPIITAWYTSKHQFDAQQVYQKIQSVMAEQRATNQALVYKNKELIMNAIADEADKIMAIKEAKPRQSPDAIVKLYDQLDQKNQIGTATNVYPGTLSAWYNSNPLLKLVQDELRYVSNKTFADVENSLDAGRFFELSNLIGDCLHARNRDERLRCLQLLNPITMKYLIAPMDKVEEIGAFVLSPSFFSLPLVKSDGDSLRDPRAQKRWKDMCSGKANIEFNIKQWLSEFSTNNTGFAGAGEKSPEQIAEKLKKLSPDDLEKVKELLGF